MRNSLGTERESAVFVWRYLNLNRNPDAGSLPEAGKRRLDASGPIPHRLLQQRQGGTTAPLSAVRAFGRLHSEVAGRGHTVPIVWITAPVLDATDLPFLSSLSFAVQECLHDEPSDPLHHRLTRYVGPTAVPSSCQHFLSLLAPNLHRPVCLPHCSVQRAPTTRLAKW